MLTRFGFDQKVLTDIRVVRNKVQAMMKTLILLATFLFCSVTGMLYTENQFVWIKTIRLTSLLPK
jgi:hypothetical protein